MRSLLAALAVALVIGPASADAAEPPRSNTDYWAFADRIMGHLDSWWDASRGAYILKGTPSVRVNSAMLLAHAVAAQKAHGGPTRQDTRAREIVDRLTSPPAWLGAQGTGGLTTCWSRDLARAKRQHASLEPKVAEALAWAWRARRPLGLSAAAVRRIERTVTTCARSRAWHRVRVTNQINWNAELYAAAATVSGRAGLLRHEYRHQLASFAAHIARPARGMATGNLGRGYQFHYYPQRSETAAINLDSPEYANIVVHAITHYDEALRQGMRPLTGSAMRRMRGWVTRLLAGSWTHAGYLNWDTGKGRRRWHSAQYWAFAQQGLLAIATSPRFWRHRVYGRWAKALFDRGLELYQRRANENGGLAPKHMFGVHTLMEEFDCFCARMLANATRAVALDLGSRPSEVPPPLYAFDPDTGRLAVTTPRYSTAIVPDNRGAFAYGGIDPARLFGPGQTVAANVGGIPPAAFGVVVSNAAGREWLASQHSRSGRLRVSGPHHRRPPDAGPFRVVTARGSVSRGGVRINATHRFRAATIVSRWQVTCQGRCRYRVRVHFPTWGAATITAIRRDGTPLRLEPGASEVPLADVAALELGHGYRLVPLDRARGAVLSAVRVARQPTNPHPGPTLRIELVRRGAFHQRSLAVRIVPTG
ncbi:MAG TPA: hypothetical protein VFX51_21700 [Solirubrobacteraceae bacterium]|nr:hypothetical protein [Solirubrobacteraceae bacterium]